MSPETLSGLSALSPVRLPAPPRPCPYLDRRRAPRQKIILRHHSSPARWNGPPSRRNRAELLPLPRRQERQAAPTELTGDRGPRVRIRLGPAASHTRARRRASFGATNIRACRRRRVGDGPDPLLAPTLASMI